MVTPPAQRSGGAAVPPEALRAKLSKAYAGQSRESMENAWIIDHLPLVRHVVSRIVGHLCTPMDKEDLISAGTLGLVKAARAFDPARNVEFKTYAYIRIRGSVIDELRGRTFVPATVHSQILQAQKAYRAHLAERGGPPRDEDLAARLGISLAQLYRTLVEARKQHFLSIHGLSDEQPALGAFLPPDRGPSPDVQAERKEILERLAGAIRGMPRRDRLILLLYYERDLTMRETAEVLGITESRVSQLHASALFKLAMKLGADHEQRT